MGRRHKNTKYSYASFNELREELNPYDLSKARIINSTRRRGSTENSDITIYKRKSNGSELLIFSFTKFVVNSKFKFDRCKFAIIKDRLYFINGEDMGYKISFNNSCNAQRGIIRIKNLGDDAFDIFIGEHDIKFDDFNKAYFVEAL